MSWLDRESAAFRREMTDAGRLGSGRFAGPNHRCVQCDTDKPKNELTPLERNEWICDGCAERNAATWERMLT